jgi:hypothetical protein
VKTLDGHKLRTTVQLIIHNDECLLKESIVDGKLYGFNFYNSFFFIIFYYK